MDPQLEHRILLSDPLQTIRELWTSKVRTNDCPQAQQYPCPVRQSNIPSYSGGRPPKITGNRWSTQPPGSIASTERDKLFPESAVYRCSALAVWAQLLVIELGEGMFHPFSIPQAIFKISRYLAFIFQIKSPTCMCISPQATCICLTKMAPSPCLSSEALVFFFHGVMWAPCALQSLQTRGNLRFSLKQDTQTCFATDTFHFPLGRWWLLPTFHHQLWHSARWGQGEEECSSSTAPSLTIAWTPVRSTGSSQSQWVIVEFCLS